MDNIWFIAAFWMGLARLLLSLIAQEWRGRSGTIRWRNHYRLPFRFITS